MAKLDPLTTITSGFNSTAQLNSNFTKIEEAFDNTLSRDGSTPNFMDAVLDMNSNRIINLLDPVDNQDAVTKSFLEANISGDVDIAAAAASAAAALVSETNAATSATEAAAVENSQISYTFDTDTTMNDPGIGDFKYNNASVSSVTAIAFDATMAQSGNPDISDYIVTWDDSTNVITGHITLIKRGNAEVFAIFTVSAVTDNTGWLQVTVSHVSSSGTFSATDTVDIQFARAGNLGGTLVASDITGQSSGTVALTDNFVYENGAGGLETDTIQGIVDLASGGGDLLASNNLSDVGDTATSLTNLGGIGPSTSNTLINKTYDANGTGNVLTNVDIGNSIAASQAEAEAGTNNTKLLTPLRVSQAIAALAGGGTNWTYVDGTVTGDDILFSAIPAGVKEIEMFATDLRQTSTTPSIEIQIGDSGGIETSGYHSVNIDILQAGPTLTVAESTTGLIMNASVQSAVTYSFMARLAKSRDDNSTWHCEASGMDNPTGGDASYRSFGRKTLTAELTQIRLHKTTSDGAFDAGKLYIRYR